MNKKTGKDYAVKVINKTKLTEVGVGVWGEEQIAVSLEADDSIVCEEDVQSLLDLCDQSLLAIVSKWCVCSHSQLHRKEMILVESIAGMC